jgi:2-keto-4-pentenoate hydratase
MEVRWEPDILKGLLEPFGQEPNFPVPCGPLWVREEAERLYHAEQDRRISELLSVRRPAVSVEDAYQVQWCGVALRVREGARVIGHKVGLTSKAMQQQFGIDEPDSGLLLDRMIVDLGDVLAVDGLLAPRVEAEIAFRLGTDVQSREMSEEALREAVAETFLALEVIDSRYGLNGLTLADSVADNAACARIVLGQPVQGVPQNLTDELLTLSVDGTMAVSGYGRAVLGNPVRSLLWLARRLDASGVGLRAGDIVLAGAVHASLALGAGQTVAVSSPRLPEAVLHAV